MNLGAISRAAFAHCSCWRHAYRLPPRRRTSRFRGRPAAWRRHLRAAAGGILDMWNMFSWRRAEPDDDLRAGCHAVHHGVDHHPAHDHVMPSLEQFEGRRGRPAQDHAVHPLRHTGAGDRSRRSAFVRAAGQFGQLGLVVTCGPGFVFTATVIAGHRNRVHHVARRADYRARPRQRHLDDHFRRHRRRAAVAIAGTLLELVSVREMNALHVMFLFLMAIAVTGGVVLFVERGQRRITVNYARQASAGP